MRSILEGDDNFLKLSGCYEEKTLIKKELNDINISDEKKEKLEKRLKYLREKIPGLRMVVEDKIKVS